MIDEFKENSHDIPYHYSEKLLLKSLQKYLGVEEHQATTFFTALKQIKQIPLGPQVMTSKNVAPVFSSNYSYRAV
jgi:hypothetical protein